MSMKHTRQGGPASTPVPLARYQEKELMKTSSRKFEITDIAHEKHPFLHRIRALRDVGIEVRAGDLGGFVEGEFNLSQEADDASWIFDDAIAAGSASVDGNSYLRGRAIACEQAYVSQRASLSGHARAEDSAFIRGAVLGDHARAAGSARILNSPDRGKYPKLDGHCVVFGTVMGDVRVTGTAVILREEQIFNDMPDALVIDGHGRSIIRDPSRDVLRPNRQLPEKQEKPPRRKGMDR